MTELTGQIINGYTIKESIGSGGQSIVYVASHEKWDEDVILRGSLPRYSEDDELIKRLQMEAVIFFRLKHPNIVPLLDYWRDNSGTWLVQKYMRGGSLREKIAKNPNMPLENIAVILEQVGAALDFTHSHKIIHRDIKPANILFDEAGVAYVHDFGVAKRLRSETITRADVIIGSPAYLSPEQIKKMVISPQTDIYILGVALFETITGYHPFASGAYTKMQIILKHLQAPLPRISIYRADVPKQVEAVLDKATAKDPRERYPDMQSLTQAFREAIS